MPPFPFLVQALGWDSWVGGALLHLPDLVSKVQDTYLGYSPVSVHITEELWLSDQWPQTQ